MKYRNNTKVTLSFDGTEESITKAVRQYTADLALRQINQESVDLLMNSGGKNAFRGVRYASFKMKQFGEREIEKEELLNGWILHDLAYHIILHSNDFRGKEIESEEELAALTCAISAFNQKKEEELLEDIDHSHEKGCNLKFYLWGFSGEQFKYQALPKCLDNAGRELFILFDCGSKIDIGIDICEIVRQETGMSWEEVISYIWLAWLQSTRTADLLTDLKSSVKWNDQFSFEKYSNVIKRYSLSYDDIRREKDNLGRQLLYTKPYVKTQKGSIISINTYLDLFLYEHCILWIARDYFNQKNDPRFPSDFGVLFERYFQDVLEQYLGENDYERILEHRHKRADWSIQLMGYRFLVEQKSAFISLKAKQQDSNIDEFKKYCVNNIINALNQLEQTERDLNNGKYIKIVLLYEEYINPDSLDDIFTLPECRVVDDNNYWLMTISEMEMLLKYYSEDPDGFCTLVCEKQSLEESKSKDGRSIEKLLNMRGIMENRHFSDGKLHYYRELAKEAVKKNLI